MCTKRVWARISSRTWRHGKRMREVEGSIHVSDKSSPSSRDASAQRERERRCSLFFFFTYLDLFWIGFVDFFLESREGHVDVLVLVTALPYHRSRPLHDAPHLAALAACVNSLWRAAYPFPDAFFFFWRAFFFFIQFFRNFPRRSVTKRGEQNTVGEATKRGTTELLSKRECVCVCALEVEGSIPALRTFSFTSTLSRQPCRGTTGV